MWKFIEDLKKDMTRTADAIANEQYSEDDVKKAENEALANGKEMIKGDTVISPETGVVEMVNQDQSGIEIFFDNGRGIGVKFPFGPTGFKVLVGPNQKVEKGQTLIEFGPDMQHTAQVYSFTPDMIHVLTNSRFTIR